jgi:hypothetical protein
MIKRAISVKVASSVGEYFVTHAAAAIWVS